MRRFQAKNAVAAAWAGMAWARTAWAGTALAAAMLAMLASAANAAPVQLINNGPSANRVDLVILGDGYRSSELSKFATDAQAFVDKFFLNTPFKEYAQSFNVWRLDTASAT